MRHSFNIIVLSALLAGGQVARAEPPSPPPALPPVPTTAATPPSSAAPGVPYTPPATAPAYTLPLQKPPELAIAPHIKLPDECGGGELPIDWTLRTEALDRCAADLKNRKKVLDALAAYKAPPEGSKDGSVLPGQMTDQAKTLIGQVNTPAGTQTTAPPPSAPTSEAKWPELRGGGCSPICVAVLGQGAAAAVITRVGQTVGDITVTALRPARSNGVTVVLERDGKPITLTRDGGGR